MRSPQLMARGRSSAGFAVTIAVLTCLLVGCADGDDPPVTLDFSTTNLDACSWMEVQLQLDSAGAVLEHLDDGSAACTPDPLLLGCTFEFDEAADKSSLTVSIDECPQHDLGFGALFKCVFRRVDRATLALAVNARCACVDLGDCPGDEACYGSPAVCVSPAEAPGSCEHCNNDMDDDGNGLVDCDDPICWADCGVGETGTTCPTSTTSTTAMPQ
ncbi:MAG: hypothetical protein HY899_04770 [Deltaproteobacteria bacterium]|nr:hypothetical protein [Deltaproteobacteria bacterium]